MPFFPADHTPPEGLQTAAFVLEPLTPDHVELDYEAVMSSRKMLRMWSGSSWPPDDFRLADNMVDMKWHHREHVQHIAFTYTVLAADRARCLGCVYVRPLSELIAANPQKLVGIAEDEALVRLWVRAGLWEEGTFEITLVRTLKDWLATAWPFSKAYFHTRIVNPRQAHQFDQAGLQMKMTLELPQRGRTHYFFA